MSFSIGVQEFNGMTFLVPSISRMLSADAADGPLKTAGTVFFSFQFYRNQQVTSERYISSITIFKYCPNMTEKNSGQY